MTPRELSQRLAQRAEEVARFLLPNGKRVGGEWRCGSVSGESGGSLGVHLSGDKAGVWSDFAEGAGGDLIDLWCAVRGIGIASALEEIRGWLGVQSPRLEGGKQYMAIPRPQCASVNPMGAVMEYLTGERKLNPQTLAAFKIAESGRYVILPYLDHTGELMMCKKLGLDRVDGKKDIRLTSAEQQPSLFGWQAVPVNSRTIAITEGEIDAMSLHQFGVPALSVPFGGGGGAKQNWIEYEYDALQRFDEILLCLDSDEQGKAASIEIARRLGNHRCKVVTLPYKDANECLQKGVSAAEVSSCVLKAKTLDPSELRAASEYVDEVLREFAGLNGDTGFRTPWKKVGDLLMFRPGEVTVIAGVNAHGKSEGAGHLTLEAMRSGWKACVASLEFKPCKWIKRLTRQASGVEAPEDEYIRAIHKWYAGKLWCFDVVGVAKTDTMLEVFSYAVKRYGIKLFVIDNLSKLDISIEDYEAQRILMDKLTDFAKQFDAHVFIVTHIRKSLNDDEPANKLAVKGSGAITDLADTVLIWWRNRPKEKRIKQFEVNEIPPDLALQYDALLVCEKQRNGEDEPTIALWFDRASHQFLSGPDAKPWQYVGYSKYSASREMEHG